MLVGAHGVIGLDTAHPTHFVTGHYIRYTLKATTVCQGVCFSRVRQPQKTFSTISTGIFLVGGDIGKDGKASFCRIMHELCHHMHLLRSPVCNR